VEGAYIAETLNLVEYVESEEDPLTQIVRTHQHNTNSALLQTANKYKANKKYNNSEFKRQMGRKKDARTHGQFPRSLDEKLVDKEQSYDG
jgi:hypothetical protein